MGQTLCDFSGQSDEFFFEVTEERGNAVKRAFGRRYFLVVPFEPAVLSKESVLEIRTGNLVDTGQDKVTVNGIDLKSYLEKLGIQLPVSSIDTVVTFCRNPLKQTKRKRGFVHGKVIPFKNNMKIVISQDYLGEAVSAGRIRVTGFE